MVIDGQSFYAIFLLPKISRLISRASRIRLFSSKMADTPITSAEKKLKNEEKNEAKRRAKLEKLAAKNAKLAELVCFAIINYLLINTFLQF